MPILVINHLIGDRFVGLDVLLNGLEKINLKEKEKVENVLNVTLNFPVYPQVVKSFVVEVAVEDIVIELEITTQRLLVPKSRKHILTVNLQDWLKELNITKIGQ